MAYEPAAARPTKRITLVSNKNHWVDIYTSKNWADRKAFREVGLMAQDGTVDSLVVSADLAFKRLIADWSLDDKDGKKLELTQANFDKLADADLDVLMDAITLVISPNEKKKSAQKKSSSKKSTPTSPEPAVTPPTNS